MPVDIITKAEHWLAGNDDTRNENEGYIIQELVKRVKELERDLAKCIDAHVVINKSLKKALKEESK